MKKIIILILPLFLFALSATAQDSIKVRKNTLNEQMTDAFDKSNSYQEYKVVKKTQLATLKRNILDSVSSLEKRINSQQIELGQQKAEIDSLRQDLKNTQQTLSNSKEKEDGIAIFGILTSKTTYNVIMWTIIVLLLVAGGFLFYKFINSSKITNAAEQK